MMGKSAREKPPASRGLRRTLPVRAAFGGPEGDTCLTAFVPIAPACRAKRETKRHQKKRSA
jgi:hypothetical protein